MALAGLLAMSCLAACGWNAARVAAGETDPRKKDSLDRNYAEELPRIPPTEPGEALKTFRVAEGFRIEQVAAEPLLTDPVAMAFDENGRLYLVEMRGYSEDDQALLGQVRVLEDQDGDGRFDRSHVLIDGLSWPTAITCYGGGVFVGAAPDIWYFKDRDGDGRADVRQKVYTGFGRGNVQGLLNTFKWGLDNRVHGATSSSGATVTQVADRLEDMGSPGEQDRSTSQAEAPGKREALSLRGRDFAFDPLTLDLYATSGGGQHGMSFNAWGEKFVCSNSDHIQAVLFEERYLARNPYLAAPSPRKSIAADGPQADVFRASPVEPWRIVRTRLRRQGIVPGPVERGGKAAGYFTGATGITIYRGHDWPAEFSGWALIADVGSNLIHRKKLVPDGITYVAKRVDEQSELLTSSDIWFRPVQFANGPDGTLYIADMYREVIEHPKSLHPVIKQHLDLTSGRDRGRIYRLVSDGFQQPRPPRLGEATSVELVGVLDHPNGWHRETAARLLYERQDLSCVPRLEELAAEGTLPMGRIRALYALQGLDQLTAAVLLRALEDEHPRVRQHAVRLAEGLLVDSAPLRSALFRMTDDPSLHVRYQLAFTLGELNGTPRDEALARLAVRDAEDENCRLAILSSLEEGAGQVLYRLVLDEKFRQTDGGRQLIGQIARQIGKQQRSDDVAALLLALRKLRDAEPRTLQLVTGNLGLKSGTPLARQVADATGGRADELLKELLEQSVAKVRDSEAKIAERVAATRALRLGDFASQGKVLGQLLEPSQPAELQAAALDALASFDDSRVGALLIQRWAALSPALRGRAGDVLATRTVWLNTLLDAVEQGEVAVGDLAPGRWQLLAVHGDPGIRRRAEKLAGQLAAGRRGDVVKAYQEVLELPGDAGRGKAVFKKNCAGCHQLEGVGYPLAPNLAAMKNRGSEAVLLNVLDPNREVNPKYLNYALITADGRALSGMIAAETATSVTLKRADDAQDTILRIDIDEMRSTGMSLMPEGLEKQIDKQAMADLLAYLQAVE